MLLGVDVAVVMISERDISQTHVNTMELRIVTEGNTAYGMVQDTSQAHNNTVEKPIVTEGNDTYATVEDTDQAQNDTMEQPIVTEGNTAYGMVQDTGQIQVDAMEQPIVTQGNTAYGMAVAFDQQQQNIEQSAAVGETVYEAIPDGEATEESVYDYPNFSSEEDDPQLPADWLPSVQQQANVTSPVDPDYI